MTAEENRSSFGAALGGTVYTAVLHVLFPAGIIAFLLYGVPRFERAYGNLQAPLPEVTQLVIDVSQSVRVHAPRVIGGVSIVLALDLMIYFMLRRSAGRLAWSLWSGLFLFGEIGVAVFCVIAMILPVSPLRTGLESACLPW